MICPYYKNKEIFDGFNEIIKALGGKAMTEEEFRDPELRKLRSGADRSAVVTAYRTYDRNGGNLLNFTPQGKPSLLFLTLLDHFGGDRSKAIVAKSNVYSDEFFNWFGDWTAEEVLNVSKVVDENGEPLVVWHHTNNKTLDEFKLDFENYFQKNGGTNKAFFFDENVHGTLNRKYDMPVFLNIKELNEYEGTKEHLHQLGTTYREVVNKSAERNDIYGGVHMKDFDDNRMEHQSIWIPHNPNQIKHVENLGTWSTKDNNIYKLLREVSDVDEDVIPYSSSSELSTVFGNTTNKLLNGETVSSREIMQEMMSNGVFYKMDRKIAAMLARHDVPVRISYSMGLGELATTITEDGGSVIFINPSELSQVSKGYAGVTIMHELIHALTVDMIKNPKTPQEKEFVEANKKAFKALNGIFSQYSSIFADVENGYYALQDEYEFAACFMSDPIIRKSIFDVAEKIDRLNGNNNVWNRLKNLINKFVRAIAGKAVFNTDTYKQEFEDYQHTFKTLLYNTSTINEGNIPSESKLREIYKLKNQGLLNHEHFIEEMLLLRKAADVEKHYLLVGSKKNHVQIGKNIKRGGVDTHSIEEIKGMLKTRIKALQNSNMDSIKKGRLISITQTQYDLFCVELANTFYAIQNILTTSIPQIIEDVDTLRQIRRENGVFTNDDYMYQMHANIGMYQLVFIALQAILQDSKNRKTFIEEFNKLGDKKISEEDLKIIDQHLDNAVVFTTKGVSVLEYMLKENVIHELKKQATLVGSPTILKYIDALNSQAGSDVLDDIGMFLSMLGSSDSSSIEAIRTLSHIINDADYNAMHKSRAVYTRLIRLQQELGPGERSWDIYERDINGNFTGYMVRDLNFGQFMKDYDEFLYSLNKTINKLFGLELDLEETRTAPSGEDGKKTIKIGDNVVTAKLYYEQLRNSWLSLRCIRRYKPEYYEQYSNLPDTIKQKLSDIRVRINAITSRYKDLYDSDGHPHYEQLSEEDWQLLNYLWEERRQMRSPYNEYGFKKEGEDLEEAMILDKLYTTLYNIPSQFDKTKNKGVRQERKYNRTGWEAARQLVIDKYGENSDELRSWDDRNSRSRLKLNKYNEAIVFNKIEEEVGISKIDYGPKYAELQEYRLSLLNNYRRPNGDVDIDTIPQVIKNIIKKVDLQLKDIREEAKKDNKKLAELSTRYAETLKKYIKWVDTYQFSKIRKEIHELALLQLAEYSSSDDLSEDITVEDIEYSLLKDVYGYYYDYGDGLESDLEFRPFSYLLKMEAIDPQYMTFEPNDGWIDRSENDQFDPAFDEKYGSSMIPRRDYVDEEGRKRYDNSKQYNKIFGGSGSQSLLNFYNGVQQVITEANEMQGREHVNNFMLPQKECGFLSRFARKAFYAGFKDFWYRFFGFGRIINRGALEEDPNQQDVENKVVEESVIGTYPDGRRFNIIPQYFTHRMKHPAFISKNIVETASAYYHMSAKYNERQRIRNTCEAIVDMIKRQKFKDPLSKRIMNKVKFIGDKSGESNAYKYARDFVERDLYDVQTFPVVFSIGGYSLNFSRILGGVRTWATATNLGMSPKVAMVGFLTTMFTHVVNACTGYKYSRRVALLAGLEAVKELGRAIFSSKRLSSRLSKNKLTLLLEMCDLGNQLLKKVAGASFDEMGTDIAGVKAKRYINKTILNLYTNATFGLLSAQDIASKSTIMLSTFMSYRFINGQFITRHMIEESRGRLTDEEYNKAVKDFESSNETLYSLLKVDSSDGEPKLVIDKKYQSAWDNIRNTAINKAVKTAEDADGMATRLQKAMMTRNFIGAFILVHRQYIPLMLQKTFGLRVWDYDTQEYKNGQFRTMVNYIKALSAASALRATAIGSFMGVAFGGFGIWPLLIGGTPALAYSLYRMAKGGRKTTKQVKNEFFNDYSDDLNAAESTANKYQVKLTIYEVLLILLAVSPLANLMCTIADGSDKKDKLKWIMLQTLAYWARGFQWEANAKYNLLDLANTVKNPSAVLNISDRLLGAAGWLTSRNLSNGIPLIIHNLFESVIGGLESISENKNKKGIVKKGVYKGWSRGERDAFKLFPAHNIYEQLIDPAAKRRYQENQIMMLDDEDKLSVLYDVIQYIRGLY